MNLSAYDIVNEINHRMTWIDTKGKYIISNNLPIYKYYFILKRYDEKLGTTYYLALTSTYSDDPQVRKVYNPKNNRTKYYIADIINNIINNKYYDNNEVQIRLDKVDEQEDGIIYEIVLL
ncbi:MAG: hypothetical protein IJG68_01795 [Bacilli bacterium]|nr:hypothetical protein [Bacilli bacterium]